VVQVRWLVSSIACRGLFLLLVAFVTQQTPLQAQSQFAPGEDFVEEIVLRDLPISTAISFASSQKAYLALKIGIIRVVENGALLSTPFIDLSSIVNKATDRGLLGLAVDPDFPQKPFIYISYVWDPPGYTPDAHDPRLIRIARLTADASKNYNVALPDSLEVIVGKNSVAANMAGPVPPGDPNIPERASCMTGLTIDGEPIEDCIAADATSHTAGTLIFGPNRTLFISLGDGASYDGPSRVALRAQNLDSLSGRILRINPDTGKGLADNPWFDASNPSSNRSRTWAYGFRNPFRITLRPSNGDAYIGDVGSSYYEEINVGKGGNFGWPCYEGGFLDRQQQQGEATTSVQQPGYRAHPRTAEPCAAMYGLGQAAVKKPFYTYRHPYDQNGRDLGSSVTGLAFYNGTKYPAQHRGALFFADYARLWIKYLTFDSNGRPTSHDFATEVGSNLGAVELLSGPDKSIYAVYIDLVTRTSQVRKFRHMNDGDTTPIVKASLSPTSGAAPLVVSASASQSIHPTGKALAFSWDFGDGTTADVPDTEHVYVKAGTYTTRVTVSEKSAPFASATDTFTVRVGANAPAVKIDTPVVGAQYQIGEPVAFSGSVTGESPENVTLSWAIIQIHNEHTHLVQEIEGKSGSFIPQEHSDNTKYQLCLLATSQQGLTDQKCVVIPPRTSPYVFDSLPSGATLTYVDEEHDFVTPYIAHPIVGSEQTLYAYPFFGGRSFVGWSDGNVSQTRRFTTQPGSQTFTALYENRPPRALISPALTQGTRKKRSIVLDARGSSDPEGEALSYRWQVSDRTRYQGAVLRKTFKRDGLFSVTLRVTDTLGAQAVMKRRVRVSARKGARLLK
jgi:glucose/arabinose dehydrogenase